VSLAGGEGAASGGGGRRGPKGGGGWVSSGISLPHVLKEPCNKAGAMMVVIPVRAGTCVGCGGVHQARGLSAAVTVSP
jgi:hypothetical protein